MSGNPPRKKIQWRNCIALAFSVLIGVVCGIFIAMYLDSASADKTLGGRICSFAMLFVGMYAAIFAQLVIHEAGHLVFGLMTGYRFSSFRIGSLLWVKLDEKLRFKRLAVAGTGGQCLMAPPEGPDQNFPVVLYNLGGSLMNMVTGGIFLGLYFWLGEIPFISTLLLMAAAIGVIFAVMNGVPMRTGAVDNDGYNALSLRKDRAARRSFWLQLKMNEQMAKGVRIKDMPEEWFAVPGDDAMKNSMAAVMAVFVCNRLMDEKRFEEADRLMAHVLEMESAMVGLHRSLLICDRIYCELIGANRQEELDRMLTKGQKKFMRSMKKFPSVLRTEYAYALLAEKDAAKAERTKARFEKCAKTYPYPQDVQSERELMEIAEKKPR